MSAADGSAPPPWPRNDRPKQRGLVLGMRVDRVSYDEAVASVVDAAREHRTHRVAAANVHLTMERRSDVGLAALLDDFELIVPDGQPIRWMLNAARTLDHRRLTERVYGPELMLRVCRAAAEMGLGVYLYGSVDTTLEALERALVADLAPGLHVCGRRAPQFGAALWSDARDDCARIVESGADIVLVGLGCPRQERWVGLHAPVLRRPCVAVGAAFDLWAGNKRMAPHWMQRTGLEWLYRLGTEPQRTWRRYLIHNPRFAVLATAELLRRKTGR